MTGSVRDNSRLTHSLGMGLTIGVAIGATIVALLLGEILSRTIAPIAPGATIEDERGNIIALYHPGTRRFIPNLNAYQRSTEFVAPFSITAQGYRGPATTGLPQVVVVGDSFTFGTGLTDEETFTSHACQKLRIECANLGLPGSGTGEQLDVLEERLVNDQWRPKVVILVPLVMTSSLFGGNDLEDNLRYVPKHPAISALGDAPGTADKPSEYTENWHVGVQRFLVHRSNLFRLAKFHFGAQMRSVLSPGFQENELHRALELTRIQFVRAQTLAQQYSFKLGILVIHPMQDLARGTAERSFYAVQSLMPELAWRSTYQLFHEPASNYFYPFDGHFNRTGAATVAPALAEFVTSLLTPDASQKSVQKRTEPSRARE